MYPLFQKKVVTVPFEGGKAEENPFFLFSITGTPRRLLKGIWQNVEGFAYTSDSYLLGFLGRQLSWKVRWHAWNPCINTLG